MKRVNAPTLPRLGWSSFIPGRPVQVIYMRQTKTVLHDQPSVPHRCTFRLMPHPMHAHAMHSSDRSLSLVIGEHSVHSQRTAAKHRCCIPAIPVIQHTTLLRISTARKIHAARIVWRELFSDSILVATNIPWN
ncbi:hypothetical protein IG631_18267 [Alternaria alternata]|nr:hypothetical protein IG631_18267 [Alternaria alternata]